MKIYKYNEQSNVCGANIRKYRKAAEMSQEQLASSLQLLGLDVSQKAISRTECGERFVPDFELLYYARALKVSIQDLLQDETSGLFPDERA